MGSARRLVRAVVASAVAVGVASAVAVAIAAPADETTTAADDRPAPGFEEFAGCPNLPNVENCIRAVVDGGHMKLGNKDVPITDPIVMRGGSNTSRQFVFTSVGGFDAPDLKVPGGLAGITGWPESVINLLTLGANKLFADAQLAGTASNPIVSPFILPLKIQLKNIFLHSCFIGTAESPVSLRLTTGRTFPPPGVDPIFGRPGQSSPDPNNPKITRVSNGLMVDNRFTVPGASGCNAPVDFLRITNALVNEQADLPAEAGEGVAEFEFDARVARRSDVYPSS